MNPSNFDPSDAERRANIEKLLGPLKGTPLKPTGKYTVRLGDTLPTIATNHPLLNDVRLWKLLAEKNNLSMAVDAKGNPTVNLRRGTQVILPTVPEIVAFRQRLDAEQAPKSKQPVSQNSADNIEVANKKCPGCSRLTTQSNTVCPGCGFSFGPETYIDPIRHWSEPSSNKSLNDCGRKDRYPSQPSVDTGSPDKTVIASGNSEDKTIFTGNSSDDKTLIQGGSSSDTALTFSNKETRIPFQMQNSLKTDSGRTISFKETQALNFDNQNRLPFTQGPASKSGDVVVRSACLQLSDSARLIQSNVRRGALDITRFQLETFRADRWSIVLTYELSEGGTVRYEQIPGGGAKAMKIDLPLALAQEMVQTDFSENWESYCKKFLAGKRLSA